MTETQQYKPLVLSELVPPMNVTLITDVAGLQKLEDFFNRKAQDGYVGFDTETSYTNDFWNRRIRSLQFGDKNEQYVIDLLAFAGTPEKLFESQGYYGKNNGEIYKDIIRTIEPVLCSNKFLKVGQNLSFEYEVMLWNFGLRIWHLFSTDIAERVIQAGIISLKKYSEFSMQGICKRYFGILIDKDPQDTFNLTDPLTENQINYAAFDTRMPIAMWQKLSYILNKSQLTTTAQLENDAIGSYTDMHLNGQNLDDEKWIARIRRVEQERIDIVKQLDNAFIPVVGHKDLVINEDEINRLEFIWKTEFEEPYEAEIEKAAEIRLEKDKEKKLVLKKELENLKLFRRLKKAEAKAAWSEKSKARTKWKNKYPDCEGEAFINYGSNSQLLAALQQLPGMKHIDSVGDDVLLEFNDRPIIQTLRKYTKGKKDTGTYGMQWVTRWVNKACKEEGWRHPMDGRLHCLFNQLEAETGRSSSSKPNGQNLPRETEVRDCFICDPPDAEEPDGYVIVTVDMSGAELRIIADLANATSWIKAFNSGWDVHSVSTEILEPQKWPSKTVKSKLSDTWTIEHTKSKKEMIPQFNADGSPLMKKGEHVHVPPCAYYALGKDGQPARLKCDCPGHKKLREETKAINFLLCYGGGPDALADQLGITVDAAKELMKKHERAFPDVWGFLQRSGEEAKRDKESRDMYGRRRAFPTPTRESALEWLMDEKERSNKLLLPEEQQEANILAYKMKFLKDPKGDELFDLKHRKPTEKEIWSAMKALEGSISRRGKNHRIQGTNASIIKRAMGCGFDANGQAYLWHILPKCKAKLLSMVHDELILQCPKRYGEEVAQMVGHAFKRAAAEVMHKVVMEFDYHVDNRWVKD